MEQDQSFSIVIIPDTQGLSEDYAFIYKMMGQWIVSQADLLNIKMVLHVGDLVNDGEKSTIQYENAFKALTLIDNANIPMIISPGNHDYDNLVMENRNTNIFNKYFGIHRFQNSSWFKGTYEKGKVENCYIKMNIENQKFLFISLEFGPRTEVLNWADKIIQKNLDYKVILVTHSFMNIDGTRTDENDDLTPKCYPGIIDSNTGEDMWKKSLKNHSNLFAVFSGHHVPGNVSYRIDVGEKGNPVLQSFQNWQLKKNGGEGRLRLLTYFPLENALSLKVFNPYKNKYEKEEGYELNLNLNNYKKSYRYP